MTRLENLKLMLKESPGDSFLLYAVAMEHISLNDDETALKYFKEIEEKDPNYSALYYHLGKLYERKGETENAKVTYEKGLQIIDKTTNAYRELKAALDEIS